MTDYDAELTVKVPATDGEPYGPDRLIAWSWIDGRRTLSRQEQETSTSLIRKAEERCELDELDSGDVVASVVVASDGTAECVDWNVQ